MTESVYGPTSYGATMVAAPERDRLVYDLDVDVCVIGGGLAGLTTARELARRGWSVVLLEANRIAWNASGRNAGFVAPGFAERLERIIERVGLERTRALWVLSAGGVDYVRTTIRETQMPGVSPVDGWLKVQRLDRQERMFAQAELIGEKLGTEVEAWSTDQVREVLKSPVYYQGLHLPGGFHIHPLNYAIGLAAAAEEAGVKIFEQTRALAIDPAGVRKRVTTPAGRVRASHVVLAGSAHLSPLFPMVSGSVLPVASYMATTAPLGERLLDAITFLGAVTDSRRAGDYYRIIDGDRLLWGGRMTARLSAPRQLANLLRRDILKVYPQLGAVEISQAWTGIMGYAVHKMPQIGEVSPGLWVASAFGGHGLNTSAMAGELIARAIADGDDRWRLFSSYDLVYAGGMIGRAAAQVLYWFMRARDALDEQIAWQRDVARRRQEALAARVAEEAKRRVAQEAARLAASEAERRAAAEAERLAAVRVVHRAAEEAAYLAVQEAHLRAAEEEAARKAALLAAEEARREQEAEHLAAEEEAAQKAALLVAEEARREQEAERSAAADAELRAAQEAARSALENAAQEVSQQAARMAAEEAVHRISLETARLAAEAERLAGQDGARLGGEFQDRAARGDARMAGEEADLSERSRRALDRSRRERPSIDGPSAASEAPRRPRRAMAEPAEPGMRALPDPRAPDESSVDGDKSTRRRRRTVKSPPESPFARARQPEE